jgi:hypothetical protein
MGGASGSDVEAAAAQIELAPFLMGRLHLRGDR